MMYMAGQVRSRAVEKEMTALKNANSGLRAKIVELTTKVESAPATIPQALQMKKGSTVLQTKTVVRLSAIV